MSESKCKFCGYRKRHASAFVAGKEFPGWTCGTQTILSGEIVQSTECSLRSELARLQAALEEAEAKVRRIDAEDTADAKVLLAAFNRETVLKSQLTAAAERAERIQQWVEQYKQTISARMAADRRQDDRGAYAANETVLLDLDGLAALLHQTQEPSDD